jgi:sulfite oxidase
VSQPNVNRRDFLSWTATAAGAVGSWNINPLALGGEEDADAAKLVPGKDHRLIVHNAKTLELETPLDLLREQPITAKDRLFIRNNQTLAESTTLDPLPLDDWTLEVAGLVERSRSISGGELAALEQVEREIVLQCSGNGRAFFSRAAKATGAQWTTGAMGNVRFAGPTLKSVLDKLSPSIHPSARFITAEGRDPANSAEEADFEHSIPLAEALERSILALRLNGEPIPAVHGGPVRLITPGYYATMNIKWLSRLRLEPQETFNHHQVRRYRTPRRPITPGATFTYNLQNSEPNWNMRVKSVIFAPLDGEQVAAGEVEVRGVAWNDGVAKIDAVHVSTDGGKTWQAAQLDIPKSKYAWHPWRANISLAKGMHGLLARATDALGRTQPLDGSIHWNPAGYAWNGVHSIQVKAT